MTKRELQDALERSEFDRRLAELKYEPIAMPARQNLPPLPAVPVLMRGKQVPKEPPAMQELVDLKICIMFPLLKNLLTLQMR